MPKYKSVTNGKHERKKKYAVLIKPSIVKQLDAIAAVESEKDVVMTFRTDIIEQALEQFIKRYQKKNGDSFLLYQ
jgi:hypothetical protein